MTELQDEILKLKSQLEEAIAEIEILKGDLSIASLQLRAKRTTYIETKTEEARAEAIKECGEIVRLHANFAREIFTDKAFQTTYELACSQAADRIFDLLNGSAK